MRSGWAVLMAGVTATVWLGVSSGAARAELRVMESTSAAITIDDVYPDGAVFDVPAGKKIKLLKSPANTTHDIAGPYKGTLEAYKPACGVWDRFSGKCNPNSVAPVVGGTRSLTGTKPKPQDER